MGIHARLRERLAVPPLRQSAKRTGQYGKICAVFPRPVYRLVLGRRMQVGPRAPAAPERGYKIAFSATDSSATTMQTASTRSRNEKAASSDSHGLRTAGTAARYRM
jgi:hypothetical protein